MNAQTIDALNELLEDERASVEILVALTAMATDALERQALTVMGGQSVQACFDLHERLEQLGGSVTDRVNVAPARVSALEHIDERYRAFVDLAMHLEQRIQHLLETEPDTETQTVLAPLRAMHVAQAAWAIQRADEFAASREFEADFAARSGDHHVAVRPEALIPSEPSAAVERPLEPEGDGTPGHSAGAATEARAEIDALVEPLQVAAPDTTDTTDATDVTGAPGVHEQPRPAPRARRSRARWSADEARQQDGSEL